MPRIAILHPGEMGAAVGRALVDIGHDVRWLSDGRSNATAQRAEQAGLRPLDGVDDLDRCELIVSVCPPAVAPEVARSVAGAAAGRASGGLFVDANAIAPATAAGIAAEVAGSGRGYVDGGIVGPPPTASGTSRLYLSGPDAGAVAEIFRGSRIEPRVITGAGATAASAMKMTYAAWTKISSALLLAADSTAGHLGVRDALHAEWESSQPDLGTRLHQALSSAGAKGWRWEAEMREIAATFTAVDEPGGFGLAAAEVFARFARPDDAPRSES